MSQVYYTNWWGDEQYTPRCWVEILLPHIQHLKDKIIWCPFDKNDSEFVSVLSENWFKVVNSHIEYWQDFFSYEPEQWDVMISNPPYKNKKAYWERALDLNKPFALLMPINILSDSIINVTMKERERELQLLIPNRRIRFFNKITWETGKQPTFKAFYIWVNIFKQNIILEDLNINKQ